MSKKEQAPVVDEQAPVFEKGDLIAAATAFGVTAEVMAGALHAVEEPLTREQVKEAVKAFLEKPVNPVEE